jgi:N-glycosylase/DNA lyase
MVQSLYNDLGNGSSPTPSEIFSSDENYLTKKLKLGFRSKVMIEITKDLLEKKLINSEGQETNKTTYTNLLSIKGIGPYTASHSMLLLHDFSKIPVDSEVSNYLKTNYNLMPNQIADYFNPWGKYKFFGYKIRRILDQPT